MSEENVEVVRAIYRAMDRRDTRELAALLDPDAEWVPDSRVGEGPVHGRENVIRFFEDRDDMFAKLRVEPERFLDNDDEVLVFVHLTGHGHASGAPVDIRIGHLWTIRQGVAVRGEGFGDRAEALKAAGLEE